MFRINWNFIHAIIAISAIAMGAFIALHTNKNKILEYKLTRYGSLLDISNILKVDKFDFDLQIKISGKDARIPFMYNIEILNSGDIEINEADFKKNMCIAVDKDTNIVYVKPQSNNSGSQINYKIEKNTIVFEPFFLNVGGTINLFIVSDGPITDLTFDTIISGIKQLKNSDAIKNATYPAIAYTFALGIPFGTILLSGFLYAYFTCRRKCIMLSPITAYILSLLVLFAGTTTTFDLSKLYDISKTYLLIIYLTLFTASTVIFYFYIKRSCKYSRQDNATE